jgi:hypothetical protein
LEPMKTYPPIPVPAIKWNTWQGLGVSDRDNCICNLFINSRRIINEESPETPPPSLENRY